MDFIAVAKGQRPNALTDITTPTGHFRVYAVPFTPGHALQVARPLMEIDTALANLRLALIGLAVGAALLAALMGAVISRVVLAPVRQWGMTRDDAYMLCSVAGSNTVHSCLAPGTNPPLASFRARLSVSVGGSAMIANDDSICRIYLVVHIPVKSYLGAGGPDADLRDGHESL